jgi:hypothetical protein
LGHNNWATHPPRRRRIADHAYDDVVRQLPPQEPRERKTVEMDDGKSKKVSRWGGKTGSSVPESSLVLLLTNRVFCSL